MYSNIIIYRFNQVLIAALIPQKLISELLRLPDVLRFVFSLALIHFNLSRFWLWSETFCYKSKHKVPICCFCDWNHLLLGQYESKIIPVYYVALRVHLTASSFQLVHSIITTNQRPNIVNQVKLVNATGDIKWFTFKMRLNEGSNLIRLFSVIRRHVQRLRLVSHFNKRRKNVPESWSASNGAEFT